MNKKSIYVLGLILIIAGLGWLFWFRGSAPAEVHKTATKSVSAAARGTAPVATGKPLGPVADKGPILPPDSPSSAFNSLDVLQTNAMLGEIAKQDLPHIFQSMLDAWEVDHDLPKQLAIQIRLAVALREQNPTPEFWEQLRQYVANDTGSRFERYVTINAVGYAATKEAVDFLIWAATTLPDKELREAASGEIGVVGAVTGAVEMSPAIEDVWQTYNDESLLGSAANSMAQIGAPSAIELLLSAALAPDGQDDVRREIANEALTKVYTKNAVPPVAALLRKNWSDTPASELAGTILVRNVDPSAARELMAWLQNADDSAAPLAHDWVESSPNSPLLEDAKAALNPAVGFKSEAVRQAINAGLAQYNSEHTLGP